MNWLKNFGASLLVIAAVLTLTAIAVGFVWALVILYGSGHWVWATAILIMGIAAFLATVITVMEDG
jgi:hypothetical protein